MQLCMKHWDELKSKVQQDKWLLCYSEVLQKLPAHVDPRAYAGNVMQLQTVIHERGGCPVCFVGDELLNDAVHEVEKVKME